MIGYLKGQVVERSEGKLLLGVGSTESMVGYSVATPQSPSYEFLAPGRPTELFIYTHVREDALDLYGFLSRHEKELFLTLLSVNGIGPKLAMGILSRVEPGLLIRSILDGDKESLTEIPGIGKKTAERVVLELSDTIRKKIESGALASPKNSGTGAVAVSEPSIVRDAKDALLGLGYREHEVSAALDRAFGEAKPKRVEDLIRVTLQQLG